MRHFDTRPRQALECEWKRFALLVNAAGAEAPISLVTERKHEHKQLTGNQLRETRLRMQLGEWDHDR